MAQKKKIRTVNLFITPSAFSSIFKRLRGDRSDYDFSGLKDLRNEVETSNVELVLDGDIDQFIEAELKHDFHK